MIVFGSNKGHQALRVEGIGQNVEGHKEIHWDVVGIKGLKMFYILKVFRTKNCWEAL